MKSTFLFNLSFILKTSIFVPVKYSFPSLGFHFHQKIQFHPCWQTLLHDMRTLRQQYCLRATIKTLSQTQNGKLRHHQNTFSHSKRKSFNLSTEPERDTCNNAILRMSCCRVDKSNNQIQKMYFNETRLCFLFFSRLYILFWNYFANRVKKKLPNQGNKWLS